MAVNIPTTSLGHSDTFIDDIVKVYLDRPEQIQQHRASAPLGVHAAMRPFAAEGTPKEIQIVLGWLINTRLLVMSLPNDKYLAWKNDIQKLIDHSDMTREELESVIWRLNHASYVFPLACHFLLGLQERLKIMKH